MAEALYRKYRPQVFEDVVGQEPIERTLKNAIRQDKVSHAYLFCGPRGTGKTTTARLLAKALLCEHGPTPDPDGTCEDCQLVADGVHPDVYELDAASRTGVENVREEIISRVHFAPTRGRYKVYIIDEVHMLSTAAFNALLKTLEEPPSHVVFVLCTTDPQKVPETIHSRCQRFDFHRIAPESMVARLGAICMAEEVEFEGEALDLIAQRADGGLRNALTSLEQIIAFENGKVTLAGAERLLGSIDSNELAEIMAYIGRRDIANCFTWTAAYVETGADMAQFVRDMAEHVRNLYIMALVGDDAELEVSETTRRQLVGELSWFGPDRASRLLGVLGDLIAELKTSSNPRLAFEIALTRMVRPDSDLTLEALAERIEALEQGYSAVAHVVPGPPVAVHQGAVEQPLTPAHQQAEPLSRTTAPESVPAVAERVAAPVTEQPHIERDANQGFAERGFAPQPQAEPVAARQVDERQSQAEQPQPAPQPQATASGPGVSALQNPATLQRVWQAALAAVKKEKQAYGVLFMNTKALFDAGSATLQVQFSPDSSFAFNAVQKPEVQDTLAEALRKAAGEPVKFCYLRGEAAAQAPSAAAAANASSAQPAVASDPRVQPEQQAAPQPWAQAQQPRQLEPVAQPVSSAPAYDDVPYDEVPYDEVPYDEVPYDDMAYGSYDPAPAPQPAAVQFAPAPASQSAAAQPASRPESALPADVNTNASPGEAADEDPAALEAMLKASFGESVVFEETQE